MNDSQLHDRLRQAVGPRSFRHIAELTGTNHESVRRYLSGHAPSVEFLTALCRALNLSAEWLLAGRGPMRAEDVRREALRQSSAPDLLLALSHTVEALLDRVDRLERFVQTLETRLRAGVPEPLAHADPAAHAPQPQPALEPPAVVVADRLPQHARLAQLADVLPQRPPADAH